jgi:hypothetical protein
LTSSAKAGLAKARASRAIRDMVDSFCRELPTLKPDFDGRSMPD